MEEDDAPKAFEDDEIEIDIPLDDKSVELVPEDADMLPDD
jgi:hypothetical protein